MCEEKTEKVNEVLANMLRASKLTEQLMEALDNMARNEFLEIANNALGTCYTIEDVDWSK